MPKRKKPTDNILIFDGLNAIYRASTGFNKGDFPVIYNFFRNFRATIEEFNPTKVFFVLEGRPIHRYSLYPEYKANRIVKTGSQKEAAHDSFVRQRDEIIRLLQFLPIQKVHSPNYEGDDVIFSLCEDLKAEALTIISNDSDLIQLLQKGYQDIKLFSPIKKEFREAPSYFYLAFKSLVGDKSDNLPRLVSDEMALVLCKYPSKLKKYLEVEEHRADFNLNKELIELRLVSDEELIFANNSIDFDTLRLEFDKMEFKSITNDLNWKKFINTFANLI